MFDGLQVPELAEAARARLRRARLGFVFQAFHVLPHLSVAENVSLPLLLLGRPDAARVLAVLDAVGLGALSRRMPAQLSGGQLQRVAIARALVHAPALILADEPTGNLDTRRSREIMDLLVRLNREDGITIVMVTHEEDMAAYAGRLVTFIDGRIASDRRTAARPLPTGEVAP